MKPLILLFAILNLLTINIFCQSNTNALKTHTQNEQKKPFLFNTDSTKSPYIIINWYECFDENCYWPYDTSSAIIEYCLTKNCLWQIGRPLKPNLDTIYSPPNGLLTDTVNPYPINANASFTIKIKKPVYYLNACWTRMLFALAYKIDVDSFKDGFFVEISYNNTGIWNNIINDQSGDTRNFVGLYSSSDTLFNGEHGISYIHNNMQNWGVLSLEWLWSNPNAHLVDSVMFRITFISDSINNNKSGVLIDNINVRVDDLCNVNVSENKIEQYNIYPNPVNKGSDLYIESDFTGNTKVEIYGIDGTLKTVKNLMPETKYIDISALNQGMYILKFINQNFCYQKKIVIN